MARKKKLFMVEKRINSAESESWVRQIGQLSEEAANEWMQTALDNGCPIKDIRVGKEDAL